VHKCVGKGKKFVLELTTKTQKGIEVYLYSFLNIVPRRGWVIDVTARPIYPRERHSTHCINVLDVSLST